MFNAEKFVEKYKKVEEARKARNFWMAIGAGGVAVGAVVGIASGHLEYGAVIAASCGIAVEGMALENQEVVRGTRQDLRRYLQDYEDQKTQNSSVIDLPPAGDPVPEV